MKKITLLVMLVLLVAALSASSSGPGPVPPPTQRLTGTLLYGHNTVCMIRDYISLPVMENVYVVGKGFPTAGQYQGCYLDAIGSYIKIGTCTAFEVSNAVIKCPSSQTGPTIH